MSASARTRDRGEVYRIEPIRLPLDGRQVRDCQSAVFLNEVDLSEVERIREQAMLYQRPSYTAFVVKAVAMAMRAHPQSNRRVCRPGAWPFGRLSLQTFLRIDVAVAMEHDASATDGANDVDVLEDADEALIEKINADLRELSRAAPPLAKTANQFGGLLARLLPGLIRTWYRSKTESPEFWAKHRGGAVLVSSPPKTGVDTIIEFGSYPMVVTFGLVKDRPYVVAGEIVVRKAFQLGLSFDRSLITRSEASRFFHRIIEILERAEFEMKPFLLEEAPPTREDFPTINEPSGQF